MIISQLDEQPSLIQSIFTGDLSQLKYILDNGSIHKQEVNDVDSEKRSALHAATFKGDTQMVSLLLSYGARVNAKDNKWLTPLHIACHIGSQETVSILLNHQADISARDKFWQTPLHVAASSGAVECVSQLLNHIPNINVTDRSGRTALHHAALNRYEDVVELLLTKGGIVNACDKKDCRPLHWASYMGHVHIMELLLRHGADVHARDRNQYTPLHVVAASGMVGACRLLLYQEASVNAQNAYGNTPLHIACLNGHLSICEELCASGADVEAVNYRGQTPLHIAAASTHGVDCLYFLLEQKVDINKQSNDGRTPLHMTAIHGRFTKSKILIDKGAIVDATDKNGCTALHIAAWYGHELLSNTLLSYGANPSKKGYEGRTPLHMCCLSGYVECCRKFLQAGVDLNAQDDSGETPLHYAAYKGSIECLDLLVSNGADIQITDNIGRTPLHYAAVFGHYNCLTTLVSVGSNVNLADNEGCTSLHLACGYDIEGKCIEYLLEHKGNPTLKDKKGFCPIHYAVNGNNQKAVECLLKALGNQYKYYGADAPNNTPLHIAAKNGNQEILRLVLPYFNDVNIKDDNGCTALLLAAREGHTHCVQMLLRYGAKVSICDNLYNMSPIHHSAKKGHLHCLALLVDNAEDKTAIDMPDSLQRTALMLAVSSGHADCVITLLKSGANPNIADSELHSSIFRAVVTGQNNIAQLLITKGANIETSDVNGKTVLHLAAACGHFPCLQTVLNYMSEETATKVDNQNCTALHWAAYNGNQNCVEYLLKKDIFKKITGNPFSPGHCASFSGFEKCLDLLCNYYSGDIVNLRDMRNRTPLHIASLHGHADCVKYILKQGAEINCQDNKGRTPLLCAAFNGQTQIMEILIGKGADITSYDKNGNTALHLACLRKHNHAALLLLEYIDDHDIINMINDDRRTPLHLSARNGLFDVTKQLISKGASVEAVDTNGLTPALCCAPNVNVAQCLAIILANYPKNATYEAKFLEKDELNERHHVHPHIRTSKTSQIVQTVATQTASINTILKEDMTKFSLKDMMENDDYHEQSPSKEKHFYGNQCFVVGNCHEVTTTGGLDLHRSSTSTSFPNSQNNDKTLPNNKEDVLTKQSTLKMKFPRSNQYHGFRPNDNFEVLYDSKNKIHFLPKVVETGSDDEIIKIKDVIDNLPDIPLVPNKQSSIQPSQLLSFADSSNSSDLINVITYNSHESLPWQTKEEHNFSMNLAPSPSSLTSTLKEDIQKHMKVDCEEKTLPTTLPVDLKDFHLDSNKIDYLNFDTGTNCMENRYMFKKITDHQATVKKIYLGEKTTSNLCASTKDNQDQFEGPPQISSKDFEDISEETYDALIKETYRKFPKAFQAYSDGKFSQLSEALTSSPVTENAIDDIKEMLQTILNKILTVEKREVLFSEVEAVPSKLCEASLESEIPHSEHDVAFSFDEMPSKFSTKIDATSSNFETPTKLDAVPLNPSTTPIELDVSLNNDATSPESDTTPLQNDATSLKLDEASSNLDVPPLKPNVTPLELELGETSLEFEQIYSQLDEVPLTESPRQEMVPLKPNDDELKVIYENELEPIKSSVNICDKDLNEVPLMTEGVGDDDKEIKKNKKKKKLKKLRGRKNSKEAIPIVAEKRKQKELCSLM